LDAFFAFFFFFAAMSFTPWFCCVTKKLYAPSRQGASAAFVPRVFSFAGDLLGGERQPLHQP
jgi:hypothetical protein